MEVLLVYNDLPTRLFTVFHLFEFNVEELIEFIEILLHIVLSDPEAKFSINLFKSGINFLLEDLYFLMQVFYFANL